MTALVMKLKATLSISSIAVLQLGCDWNSAQLEREATAALSQILIDPTSILVRDLKYGRDSGKFPTICGEVNSKNRVGGYAGYKSFVAVISEEPTAFIDNEIFAYDFDESYEDRVDQILYLGVFNEFCVSEKEREEFLREQAEIQENLGLRQ